MIAFGVVACIVANGLLCVHASFGWQPILQMDFHERIARGRVSEWAGLQNADISGK